MGRDLSRIVLPMMEHIETSLLTDPADLHPVVSSAINSVRGAGRIVALLLEDEPLIAMDVEMTLEGAGFRVVTLVSCAETHAWLDRHIPDMAIVDVELRDGRCTDVVSRLVKANIPFVVHSGQQPDSFAGSPFASGTWVSKPSATDDLAGAARALMSGFL